MENPAFLAGRGRPGLSFLRRDAKPSAQVAAGCSLQTLHKAVELCEVLLSDRGSTRQLSVHRTQPTTHLLNLFLDFRRSRSQPGVVCKRHQCRWVVLHFGLGRLSLAKANSVCTFLDLPLRSFQFSCALPGDRAPSLERRDLSRCLPPAPAQAEEQG